MNAVYDAGLLRRLEREVVPNFLRFDDIDDDIDDDAVVRLAAAVEAFPEAFFPATPDSAVATIRGFSNSDDSVTSPETPLSETIGRATEIVLGGECVAEAALRLYARTSTGATDRDRTSSSAPECPLCYERRANQVVMGCGHAACFSCLEKAAAASSAPVETCFTCRACPGVLIRMYS